MRVDAFDPSEDEPESIDLDIDVGRYFLAYYEPFVAAIDQGLEPLVDDQTTSIAFEQIGLTVGLDNAVLAAVRTAQGSGAVGLAERVNSALVFARDREGTFPDGTTFETNWGEALQIPDSKVADR